MLCWVQVEQGAGCITFVIIIVQMGQSSCWFYGSIYLIGSYLSIIIFILYTTSPNND